MRPDSRQGGASDEAWRGGAVPVLRRSGPVAIAALLVAGLACGQKGPPLAPLRLIPAEPADLSIRRIDDRARLRFVVPSRNVEGPGPVALDRVEIFAITVRAGGAAPSDRDLLDEANRVGAVAVRPAPVEGEEPKPGDPRPAPGDTVTFDDPLSAADLLAAAAAVPPSAAAEGAAGTPVPAGAPAGGAEKAKPVAQPGATAEPEKAKTAAPGRPGQPEGRADGGSAQEAAGKSKDPAGPLRIYVARGVTEGGRPGAPSSRVQLPLTPLPPPPADVAATVTAEGVTLEWAPPAEGGGLSYNVYLAADPGKPLNASAIAETEFQETAVALGEERCYRLRSVARAGTASIEGPLSDPVCVTPRDVFPPAAPRGLAAVPTPGQISLIWEANTEDDLGGYIVLRGEAPDGPLRALTPEPIAETFYRDTAVAPGTRYVYAVVAVDTASPPNTSPQSAAVEETAR